MTWLLRHTMVYGHCFSDAASLDCFVPRNDAKRQLTTEQLTTETVSNVDDMVL